MNEPMSGLPYTSDQKNILIAVEQVVSHSSPGYVLVVQSDRVTTYGHDVSMQHIIGEMEIQKISLARTGLAQREHEE